MTWVGEGGCLRVGEGGSRTIRPGTIRKTENSLKVKVEQQSENLKKKELDNLFIKYI